MKLREFKTKYYHYFKDEHGRKQGKCKTWWLNGQLWAMRYYKDNYIHGEYKRWHQNGQQGLLSYRRDNKTHGEYKRWNSAGELLEHTFYINEKEIIDFLKNPELYPETPEEKTMFALKYGSGSFIGNK